MKNEQNEINAEMRTLLGRIDQYAHGRWYQQPALRGAPEASTASAAQRPPATRPPSASESQRAAASEHLSAVPATSTHTNAAATPTGDTTDIPARHEQLKQLYERIAQCTKCPLHEGRTQTVPGSGVLDPAVMIVGEAPGANEDRYGKPFIGRAGRYLDSWLQAIGIHRTKNAYIANIIKCRPPQNRDPVPNEIAHCKPYLDEQLALIRPKMILVAGRIAAHHLFDISDSLAQMRNRQYDVSGIPAIVTYHPSAVLRNPTLRRPVWEDLQKLQRLIAEQ